MPGIQSTKETCTGGSEIGGSPHGALACAERIAASMNVQLANANWGKGQKRPEKVMTSNRTSAPAR